MNYSPKQLAEFIQENISLTPNERWSIYDGPDGLMYLRSNHEKRDNNYRLIMSFKTMDEVFLNEELIDSIAFQINQQNND